MSGECGEVVHRFPQNGNPIAGFWKTSGLVLGGMAALVAIACATEENVCNGD